MKSFVLVMALCFGAILVPGAAEAHVENCSFGYYFSVNTGDNHAHQQNCDDPVPGGGGSLFRYLA